MKKILFTNGYTSPDPGRNAEIQKCLDINLKSGLFDRVYVLCEIDYTEKNDATKLYLYGRPTFYDFFSWSRELLNIDYHAGDLIVLANSDIYFDATINKAMKMDMREVYALSRVDVRNHGTPAEIHEPFYRADSQDVWIWRAGFDLPSEGMAYFHMGKPGCDNAIAERFSRKGMAYGERYERAAVSNPCKSINCFHLHETGLRTYTPGEACPRPYKLLTPTAL